MWPKGGSQEIRFPGKRYQRAGCGAERQRTRATSGFKLT